MCHYDAATIQKEGELCGIVFELRKPSCPGGSLVGAEDEFLSSSIPRRQKRETGFSSPLPFSFGGGLIPPPPLLLLVFSLWHDALPFFFSSFFSAVSWSGGGGHGGEWVAPCAAEGNKPKASPRPVSQPPFLFFKENIFHICQPLEALTQAPSFKMMPTCAHDFRSLSARLSSEATL